MDSSSITSFRFESCTGWDGKHKKIATKVSLIGDRNGLPVDALFGEGSKHDLRFIDEHVENLRGRRIDVLNLDKGYIASPKQNGGF